IRLIPWDGTLDPSQPAPGLTSEWSGIGIRAGLQDRMARGGFMDAVKNHPVRVLMIYLVRKPLDIVSILITPFARGITWLVLSLLVGLGIGALVVRFGRQDDVRAPRDMILLSGGAVVASTMPDLWAYPRLAMMGDSILLLAAFASITVAMGTVTILIHWRAVGEKRSELIRSGREAKEGMIMRAVVAPLYRLAEHARGYELAQRVSRPTTESFRALTRSRVSPSPSENLLDVGCGRGHYRSSFTCQYSGV